MNTDQQYQSIIQICSEIFKKKNQDYGTAWRILRTSSLTDQIFIKAQRIRTLEQKGVSKVEEGVEPEFIGIINYSIMALIQLEKGVDENLALKEDYLALYKGYFDKAMELMQMKNHDYGEAWRSMRQESFTDLILMKLLRIKSIDSNDGNTLISEGVDANYFDIINYAVFALIKLKFV